MERTKAHRERRGGGYGWGLLFAGIAAYDIYGPETLTNACKRGLENETTRPLVLGAMAITNAHLLGLIPREFDPFYLLIDHGPLAHADIDKGEAPSIYDH